MSTTKLAFEYAGNSDQPSPTSSIGTVTGIARKSKSRAGLSFDLYDPIHDISVRCCLKAAQEKTMSKALGRRARVTGTISREIGSGRPIAIRDILKIELLEDAPPGSYKLAKGAVPWQPGDLPPEEAVRRIRDI